MTQDVAGGSISELVRRQQRVGADRLALVDGDVSLTWAELDGSVTALANGLIASGLEVGDRIVLQLPTSSDFVALYLGALRAGLVCIPINPAYTRAEVEHVVSDSGARRIITAEDLADPTFLTGLRSDGPDPRRDRTGEDLAVLLYTSGTSGKPKGAMLSVRALLADLVQVTAAEPALVSADDVVFMPLPLFHIFGLNAGLGLSLFAGATCVLGAPATLTGSRATVVVGAPPMFAGWAAHPSFAGMFADVRVAFSGSAALPPALVAAYGRVGVPLHEGYGLTETAPVVTSNALGEAFGHPKAGSIGRPIPGVEIELRDAEGVPVDDEQDPGQIYVRGDNLFSGYWPDGHDGPDADGWWPTGDIAVVDEDGDYSLVGRITDMVLVNGFNVYPAEVEAVLVSVPGVAAVAVLGEPDEQTGERVIAYVVPAEGARLDPDAVIEAASRSLARFKLPRRIEVVSELPYTVTGKVMKWKLGSADADS